MNINIRNGNVIDELKKIPSESVDCVVSSPPYYSLRDYSGVAMYSNENVDKVKDIASSDLQKHRDCVPYPQKGRYYLTEPVFNEKEKKWFISLKYDVSEIWGGNPECEHEWKEYSKKLHNGRGDAQNSALYSKQNNIPDAEISHNVCSKCGAWKGQLGSEPTYQMYGDHLMLVMKELKRVLKKTGTLFWNMGDTYSGSGGAGGDYNTGGIREGQPKYKQGKSEIPSKSLMMIPERLAMAMIDDGWILRNTLCWFKKNAMPASVSDRFSNKWEYVFFFTKSQKYYFDLDSIRKPLAESSIKRISQENIPNQFKSGKSSEFAETNPVNNIPKIMNNMHKKYNGANPGDIITSEKKPYAIAERDKEYVEYRNLPPLEEVSDFLNKYRRELGYTIDQIEYKMDSQAPHHWFNAESYPSVVDWLKIKEILEFPDTYDNAMTEVFSKPSEKQNDPNGANPGDILFDNTIYDLFMDSNIQDAFMEYLERERPELLMPSVLDIPTMPHSFAHFAVMPETLVNPLIKAGCSSEVCIKCGKPKLQFYNYTGKFYDHSTGEYVEYHTRKKKRKIMEATGASPSSVFNTEVIKEKEIKWLPSCKCNADFEPGTVLDPFAGSGTVGVVAKKQGKNAILIEISPEYVEIIKNRLEIEASGINMNVKFVETASISSMEEEE